jgi:hypothetical protein
MENKKETETDPEGLPLNRQMKPHDQVQPTSPSPLSGKPSGFIVGSTAPGHSEAPRVAVEGPKATKQSDVQEYQQPRHDSLPDVITARQVYEDDSNPDGRVSGRQR